MATEEFSIEVPDAGDVDISVTFNSAEADDVDNRTVEVSDATAVGKSNITIEIPVALGEPLAYDLYLPYATVDDDPTATATADVDYDATSSSITIPAGETEAALPVAIYADAGGQGATITFVGSTHAETNAEIIEPGPHTIAKPSAAQIGDLMLAFIHTQGNGAWVELPPGWVQLLDEKTTTADNGGTHLSVYKKLVGADEPTSYSWVHGTDVVSCRCIVAYRGADFDTIAVQSTASDSTSDTTVDAPSATSDEAGSWLVCAFGVNPSTTSGTAVTFSTPSGMTERYDSQLISDGSTLRTSMSVCDQALAGTGSTGIRTSTVSNDGRNIGCSVLLEPTTLVAAEEEEFFFVALGTPKVTNSGGADADVRVIQQISQVTIVPDELIEPLAAPAATTGGGVMYGWHELNNNFDVWLDREKHLGKRFAMARFFQPKNRGLPSKQAQQIAEGINADGSRGDPRLMLYSCKSDDWDETANTESHDSWIWDVGHALNSWKVSTVVFIFDHEPHSKSNLGSGLSTNTATNYKLCWEKIADMWGSEGWLKRDGGNILLGYCEIMYRAKANSGAGLGSGDTFYPGNTVIDVLCLDDYNAVEGTPNYKFGDPSPPSGVRDNWYTGCQIADYREKPLLIAEFGSVPGTKFASALKTALGGTKNRDQWFKQAADFMKTNSLAREWLKGFCYYHNSRWMFLDEDSASEHPSGIAGNQGGSGVEGKTGWMAAFKNDPYFTDKMFDPTSATPVFPSPTPSGCGATWTQVAKTDCTGADIHEISGAAGSKQHSNVLWCIIDSGGPKALLRFKTTGTAGVYSSREISIPGVKNNDWEDCFYSDEGDKGKFIYIHDNMDGNKASKQTKQLHKVREPANPDTDTTAVLVDTYYWKFPANAPTNTCKQDSYPAGNQNCEAVFTYPVNNGSDDGIFYAVQKTKGKAVVYRFNKLSEMSRDSSKPTIGTRYGEIDHNCPSSFAINVKGDRAVSVSHGTHKVWKGVAGDLMSLLHPRATAKTWKTSSSYGEEAADWFPWGTCGFQVISEDARGWLYTQP